MSCAFHALLLYLHTLAAIVIKFYHASESTNRTIHTKSI